MKKQTRKGWMIEHYGLGSGIFTVYDSKRKAEHIAGNLGCECKVKPIPVKLTYNLDTR